MQTKVNVDPIKRNLTGKKASDAVTNGSHKRSRRHRDNEPASHENEKFRNYQNRLMQVKEVKFNQIRAITIKSDKMKGA